MSNYIKNLLIDSRSKINATGNTYLFNLPLQLTGVKSIQLVSCSFPQTIYNVHSQNNLLYLNDGSTQIIALTMGNFDIFDYVAMLEAALNAASTITFTVTYSLISMCLTIAGDSAFVLEWSNTNLSNAYLMGFESVDTISALSHTATKCLNLSTPMYYNVIINELGFSTKSTNPQDNGTFTIFNSVNNSDIATFGNNGNYCQCIKVQNDNINSFTIRITDYNNRDVNFNNCDWAMLLHLNYCD